MCIIYIVVADIHLHCTAVTVYVQCTLYSACTYTFNCTTCTLYMLVI